MFEEHLICEVQKNPCLYDKSHYAYRDRVRKENAWMAIAATVKRNVLECQNRWKSLRDRYVKEVYNKKVRSRESVSEHKWKYSESLSFLKDFVSSRSKSNTNIFDECIEFVLNENDEEPANKVKNEDPLNAPHSTTPPVDERSMSPNPPMTIVTSKKRRLANESKQNIFGNSMNSPDNKHDYFYQFLHRYLEKVDEEAQDNIIMEVINLVALRVREVKDVQQIN